jgi:HD-like signal output (HDOD) protein
MTSQTAIESQPLTEQIRKAVQRGRVTIPPLPELVTQLRQLLRDEARASSTRVAKLVRNDPALAASLLRMANSAAFGGLQKITDLSLAVARLGFRQVTSVVTAMAHSGHFESNDPARRELLRSLWGHAVATALAAKQIARLTSGDREESFVAGLLHDAGKLVVLKAVDHLEKSQKIVSLTPAVVDELMEVLHTELGHQILVSWHLPDPVCEAALHHHDHDLDSADTLVMRVQAADAIARKMGEHPKPDPQLNLLELASIEHLNLSDIELASLMVDLEDQIAEIRKLL